jgi:hypothetical protein
MKFTDDQKRWLLDTPGIERQHIYNWEQGGGVSFKYLTIVAKVKGITIEELIGQLLEEEKKNGKAAANG